MLMIFEYLKFWMIKINYTYRFRLSWVSLFDKDEIQFYRFRLNWVSLFDKDGIQISL